MNYTDIIDWIGENATLDQIHLINNALRNRQRALGREIAEKVKVGMRVELQGISPKYLNGLTGEVTQISGNRATVAL